MKRYSMLIGIALIFLVSTSITMSYSTVTRRVGISTSGKVGKITWIVYEVVASMDDVSRIQELGLGEGDWILRGWFKWGPYYNNFDPNWYSEKKPILDAVRALGIKFCGGATVREFQADDVNAFHGVPIGTPLSSELQAEFDDMRGRNPDGTIQTNDISIYHPLWDDYIFSWVKPQIDAGVDAVLFDEPWQAADSHDDYVCEEFKEWLRAKYTTAELNTLFGISDIDTFNYREYLAERGLSANPDVAENPLREEFGYPWWQVQFEGNFRHDAFTKQWKALIDKIHEYKPGVLAACVGLKPYVDFQTFTLWNSLVEFTEMSREDFEVMVRKKLQDEKQKSLEWLGREVDIINYIDWPTPFSRYVNWDNTVKDDYLRTIYRISLEEGFKFAFPVNQWSGSDIHPENASWNQTNPLPSMFDRIKLIISENKEL